MRTNVAFEVRRWVMALCACLLVCLVLITVESAVGIGLVWRLVLNQVPCTLTCFVVFRWSEMGEGS